MSGAAMPATGRWAAMKARSALAAATSSTRTTGAAEATWTLLSLLWAKAGTLIIEARRAAVRIRVLVILLSTSPVGFRW